MPIDEIINSELADAARLLDADEDVARAFQHFVILSCVVSLRRRRSIPFRVELMKARAAKSMLSLRLLKLIPLPIRNAV